MLSLVQQQLGGGQPPGTVAAAADEVLGVLKNNNPNKREEIEKLSNHDFNQMISIDNFSLVKCLLQNRLKIVWCTRLDCVVYSSSRAEDQEMREKIEEEMLDSGLEVAAILEQLQAD
ncbi:hypothetical protein CsSME_00030747 [Camellia sinensis var. sinensis]